MKQPTIILVFIHQCLVRAQREYVANSKDTSSWICQEKHKSSCACEDDNKKPEACWYTYWYVWLALGLFIAVVVTIVIVYVKHKSKRTRRSTVRRISIVHPQNPPPYGAPSQLPPSYEVAIKTSYPVPTTYHGGGHVHFQELNAYRLPSEVVSNPPSYVESSSHSR